jgi:cellulose synthase (UDP-forming)
MLPYMEAHPRLGIVQTPQYFRIMPVAGLKKRLWLAATRRTHKVSLEAQNWLESGAGSVQELFYRAIQQSREQHNGAICVGTNAMYRREALAQNGQGGPSLIGHSEDVHTGFDLRRLGWGLMYIPVVLAAGVCPTELQQFVQQQYRWCMGSMSLLGSRKFWQTKMTLRQRCCYLSGFCYYIHTAVAVFVAPLIPLALLWFFPTQVRVVNYLLILPSVFYNFVVFRRWHHVRHDLKAWAVKLVYAWAHGFALTDILRGKRLGWNATGAKTRVGSFRVRNVRWLIGVWGGGTGLAWAAAAIYHMVFWNLWDFAPNFLSALWYCAVVLQAVSSTKPKRLRQKQLPAAT